MVVLYSARFSRRRGERPGLGEVLVQSLGMLMIAPLPPTLAPPPVTEPLPPVADTEPAAPGLAPLPAGSAAWQPSSALRLRPARAAQPAEDPRVFER